MVGEEDGEVFGLVSSVVAGRWLGEFGRGGRRAMGRRVSLPAGYRIAWAGQFEHLQHAESRLAWVVPITLLLVCLLLYLNLKSLGETALVMLAVPFSLVGAVWMLWLLHYNLSVAVGGGVIALRGVGGGS